MNTRVKKRKTRGYRGKRSTISIIALIIIVAINLYNYYFSEAKDSVGFEKVMVTKHVDGDTIYVKFENNDEEKIRMIGVNTPETKHPTKGVEPYGKEASDFTKDYLMDRTIYLQRDVSERDRYDRLLRYLWLDIPENDSIEEVSDKMFNAILVKEGYAQVSTYPPDVKYSELFLELESEARDNSKGLWGK